MACPAERQVAKQELGEGCDVAIGLQEGLCPMAALCHSSPDCTVTSVSPCSHAQNSKNPPAWWR